MKRYMMVIMGVAFLLCLTASSEDDTASIVIGKICKDVAEREPVDSRNAFGKDAGRVYCHTKILNSDTHKIFHDYFHGGKLISSVELDVKSDSFRTWSYKTVTYEDGDIQEQMLGGWDVVVRTENGGDLAVMNFEVLDMSDEDVKNLPKEKEEALETPEEKKEIGSEIKGEAEE